MSYVKVSNGAVETYPYGLGQFRRDHKNISFPRNIPEETLNQYGAYSVTVADEPSYDAKTQNTVQNSMPTLVDGSWTLGWTVQDKTADEITAYNEKIAGINRAKRNSLLGATDYYGLSDVSMTSEMLTYRQALRDITSNANWPHLADSDWPTKP